MNFLLAGRDTTAALLTWTLFELAKNPHIKAKVRFQETTLHIELIDILFKVIEEIDRVVKKEIPTAEELQDMEYTKRVLTEVLRLHPSVPLDGREAAEDDTLPSGHPVHKGKKTSQIYVILTELL